MADSYPVVKNSVLVVPAPGVLANDDDPDDGPSPLTVTAWGTPAHGDLTATDADGSFTYEPDLGWTGPDPFAYTVSDGEGEDEGAVTVTTSESGERTGSNRVPLSRLQAGATNVILTLTFTLPVELSGTLTVHLADSPAPGFVVTQAATDAGSSDCLSAFAMPDAHTLTALKDHCPAGEVTLGGALVTNPTVAGMYTIAWVNDLEGSVEVPILENDQVAVGASVDQSLAFDVAVHSDGPCAAADPAGPNSVALGAVAYDNAHAALSTAHICLLMDTNASGGMVVQVQGDHGALVSSSPADSVASVTGALHPGTEGFGLCLYGTNPVSGHGAIVKEPGAFAGSSCAADPTVAQVPAKAGDTWVTVVNTAGAPVDGDGYMAVDAQAALAVASSTAASAGYAETWTFRATAAY